MIIIQCLGTVPPLNALQYKIQKLKMNHKKFIYPML